MWVAFANAKATQHFFSKNIGIYAIVNDQSFNNMLTNDIVSFEQLGPDIFLISPWKHMLWVLIRSALVLHENLCCGYSLELF